MMEIADSQKQQTAEKTSLLKQIQIIKNKTQKSPILALFKISVIAKLIDDCSVIDLVLQTEFLNSEF